VSGRGGSASDKICCSGGVDRGSIGGSIDGRFSFPLPEAYLLVGLNLVEEAVLGGDGGVGAEAAAGLLRAFRTVRNSTSIGEEVGGDGGGEGVSMGRGGAKEALAGGGRGQLEREGVSALVALLEQVWIPCCLGR